MSPHHFSIRARLIFVLILGSLAISIFFKSVGVSRTDSGVGMEAVGESALQKTTTVSPTLGDTKLMGLTGTSEGGFHRPVPENGQQAGDELSRQLSYNPGRARLGEATSSTVTSTADAIQTELQQLAKEAADLSHSHGVPNVPARLRAAVGLPAQPPSTVTTRELGALLKDAAEDAGRLSPRKVDRGGELADVHRLSPQPPSWRPSPSITPRSPIDDVGDDAITMRSPAAAAQPPLPLMAAANGVRELARPAALPHRGVYQVVLRKTRAHGLGMHCDDRARVTGFHGRSARDAGVLLGSQLLAVGDLEFGAPDPNSNQLEAQLQLELELEQQQQQQLGRLQFMVAEMVEGDQVVAVFQSSSDHSDWQQQQQRRQHDDGSHPGGILTMCFSGRGSTTFGDTSVAAPVACVRPVSPHRPYRPPPPRLEQQVAVNPPPSPGLPLNSQHRVLRNAATLDVYTEEGDDDDGTQIKGTPALLGPRLARVESALCILADPPLADDPHGLHNATAAQGTTTPHHPSLHFTSPHFLPH
jgi:hypothetical protein